MTSLPQSQNQTRLDSWKAIAAFLGRDERTVQRWEKERSLPVYRIPGERGRVFAYQEELTEWLQQGTRPEGELPQIQSQEPTPATPEPVAATGFRWPVWTTATVITIAVIAAVLLVVRQHRSATAHETESSQPFGKGSTNQAAEAAFLQGRFLWNQRKPETLQLALASFKEAERLDPSFAAAFAGEAETYALMPEYAAMPALQAFQAAKDAAQKAVSLNPSSASAHRVLAFALLYGDWDAASALPEFEQAVRLDPRSSQTHHWYANALMALEKIDQASDEMQKARELDPGSVVLLTDQVLLERMRGANLQESLQRLQELSKAQPNFLLPRQYAARFLLQSASMDQWAEEVRGIAEITSSPEDRRLAQVSLQLQKSSASTQKYLQTLCSLRKDPLILKAVHASEMADICLRSGDVQASAEMWQRDYADHDPEFLAFATRPEPKALVSYPEIARLRSIAQGTRKITS